MFIATVIAAGAVPDEALARDLLGRAGLDPRDVRRLADDAIDMLVDAPAADPVRAALEGLTAGHDCIVQPAATRAKALLVSDMDSTMIGQECIDELADYAGVKAEVAAVTERAMRGELDFEAALRARVALLADLPVAAIRACLAERIRPMPGAATLIATLKARGVRTVLVTGGFHAFADDVAAELGFDTVHANALATAGDRLTGTLAGRVMDAAGKERVLRETAAAMEVGTSATLGLGDGANDIPMLVAAGLGIAFRAKPVARKAADAALDHVDLTGVLYALGIPPEEWVRR